MVYLKKTKNQLKDKYLTKYPILKLVSSQNGSFHHYFIYFYHMTIILNRFQEVEEMPYEKSLFNFSILLLFKSLNRFLECFNHYNIKTYCGI